MKRLLVAAVFLLPATSQAQYPPSQVRLYLQFNELVNGYQQLADTMNQQLAVQWPQGQLVEVVGRVGNVGHLWFAIRPVTTDMTAVFYVKASMLHGKAELVDDPKYRDRILVK